MKQLYKSYITLLSKWPKDPTKEGERCLPTFLQKEVKRIFHEIKMEEKKIDKTLCNERLIALKKIVDNTYLQAYPTRYKSGIFGFGAKDLEDINSTKSRQKLGLERKPTLWQRITGKKSN
ncbi:Hypothetical protein SRAE_2000371500 [Strongyloides ratti]|uniref:Ubiquinol-cytochrome-c reductase complex assembly factor 2 n=1 Tax=Strongyloides ratti TaxID=34506 RepID=A0A090LLL3_STRRB|nr:Hypothetical protein SRAE_2000371500 [Strongyloides ratti]CEF69063.1 Hypothetical protein SRAE_2000371500 [Strongyloides ratti]